jgi:hypothetical protein
MCGVLLLGVVAAAGCTTSTGGSATPGDDRSVATSQPGGSAPRIENPVDTSRYEDDPCLILTTAQLDELNLPATGEPTDLPLGKGCRWLNETTRGRVVISFTNELGRGLSADYQANDEGKWAYFDELSPIDGLPAVARTSPTSAPRASAR